MRRVAADTETHLLKPGMLVPKLVCLSWAEDVAGVRRKGLLGWRDALPFARALLLDPEACLVGANIPYDLAVLCAEDPSLIELVFAAYDAGRITCVQTRQKLIDVARGELEFRRVDGRPEKTTHTLAALAKYWLGRVLAGKDGDGWRLRYAELTDVPIGQWPPEASGYAIEDANTTLDVDLAQLAWCAEAFETEPGKRDGVLPNQLEQMRAQFALHLMATWGLRTDGPSVGKLRAELEASRAASNLILQPSGLVRADGTRDMAAIRDRVVRAYKGKHLAEALAAEKPDVWEAMVEAREGDEGEAITLLRPLFEEEMISKVSDVHVPRTPGNQVSTDEETLRDSGDSLLVELARSGKGAKLLSTYVPILERGTKVPITSRPNVLVASGRTSWSDPNLQNPPRFGGVRDCFVPRPGRLFCFVDYSTIELRALAQVCLDLFGWSRMADALNAGRDLHAELAATILGRPADEILAAIAAGDKEAEGARQIAKSVNFACPGGLGAPRLVDFLKASGISLDPLRSRAEVRARELIDGWKATWPEMESFFDHVSQIVGQGGGATMQQIRSGRIRGGVGYCDAANSFFQGLTADGAKDAVWAVSRACHVSINPLDRPLFGSRPVLFLHDEIGTEVPEDRAGEAADAQARIMIDAMVRWIPDVKIEATPVLCRKWFKGAKPVRVDGRLVPSRPRKEVGSDGKEKVVWEADL